MKKVIIAALVALLLVIVLIIASFFIGQILVDIFLILAALVSFAAFALLGYAAFQVVGLIREIKGEMATLVTTAQETLGEVQGTARFVGETVVQPATTAAGWLSATRATVKAFTEPLYKRRG